MLVSSEKSHGRQYAKLVEGTCSYSDCLDHVLGTLGHAWKHYFNLSGPQFYKMGMIILVHTSYVYCE